MAVVFTQTTVDEDGYPVRDPGSSSYLATFAPAAAFGILMAAEARRRGAGHIRQLTILGDGALVDLEPRRPALPRRHPDRRPVPRPRAPARPGELLDFMLGDQHDDWLAARLRRARRRRHPGAAGRRPRLPAGRAQSQRPRHGPGLLRDQRPPHALRLLPVPAACSSAPAPSKPAANPSSGSASNCPACDWTQPGATGILTLRCLDASDRWEQTWQQPANRHRRRLTRHLTTSPHSDNPGQPKLPASHLHSCPTPGLAEPRRGMSDPRPTVEPSEV